MGGGAMRAGDVLDGRYQLIGELGRGGFGVVFRALDQQLEREVAVKLLADQYAAEPRDLARFRGEAIAAAKLNHRNIVALYDFPKAPPEPYMVMELITGRSLAAVLKAGRPEPDTALGWVGQLCDALDAAHRAGVVHRDIKPENIMITDAGEVRVLDFGIARLESRSTGLTSTGTVIGSPHYLAPERWRGEDSGGRSDLYAVGCVLYELCTGRTPFQAEDAYGMMYCHLEREPDAPRGLAPLLPVDLERLILDLLAKDPGDRPADAAEVRRRLDGIRPGRWRELKARADAAWALGADGDPAAAVRELRPLVVEFTRECGPSDPRTLRTGHDLALWLARDGQTAEAVGLLTEIRAAAPDGPLAEAAARDLARFERG
ncbi:serine/threonine-protein kinase [Saccharothrix sp. ST-888]|uniref:serine/threonine-protein kinase n=1 Tax=Saccharothrix sp. ST-888 TaxID=1427391 RepID=UPI0009E56CB3|nr:serine/threonine-protein kinase [Saccharothrix sp. ST-888]